MPRASHVLHSTVSRSHLAVVYNPLSNPIHMIDRPSAYKGQHTATTRRRWRRELRQWGVSAGRGLLAALEPQVCWSREEILRQRVRWTTCHSGKAVGPAAPLLGTSLPTVCSPLATHAVGLAAPPCLPTPSATSETTVVPCSPVSVAMLARPMDTTSLQCTLAPMARDTQALGETDVLPFPAQHGFSVAALLTSHGVYADSESARSEFQWSSPSSGQRKHYNMPGPAFHAHVLLLQRLIETHGPLHECQLAILSDTSYDMTIRIVANAIKFSCFERVNEAIVNGSSRR